MLTSLVAWTRAHFGLHLMFSFAGYCTMPWPLLDWRPLKTECVSNDLPAALTKLRFGERLSVAKDASLHPRMS